MYYNLGDRINGVDGKDFVVTKIDDYLRVIYLPNFAVEAEKYEIDQYSTVISIEKLKEILARYSDFQLTYKGTKLFDTYCYKVVKKSLISEWFYSCLALSTTLKYEIGKVTVPEFGKIFVFDTLENAKSFAFTHVGDSAYILKCESSSLSKVNGRVYSDDPPQKIKDFWSGIIFADRASLRVPYGTFGADWVKPIEVIE